MSEYKEFLEEKKKIDELLQQGYRIVGITENLSGAFVDFKIPDDALVNKQKTKQLHILTADARKYFSTIFFYEQKGKEKGA